MVLRLSAIFKRNRMNSAVVNAEDQISMNGPQSQTKVVIIGAGIAGVTAAAKLYHNGVKNLVVLEAQDRIGGRIQAQIVDGKNLDLGASYIHGQVDNPVFAIAHTLGIAIDGYGFEPEYRDQGCAQHIHRCSNGQKVHGEEVRACMSFVEDYLESTDSTTLKDSDSVYDIYRKAYNQYLDRLGGSLSPCRKDLLDASFRSQCRRACVENGPNDPSKLSAWAFLASDDLKGNQYTEVQGGMTKILQAISNLLPEGLIRTNSCVKAIKWNERDGSEQKAVITCDGGTVYEADHVIVTISPNCLKATLSMFEPALPSLFTNALDGVQLGSTVKVFLEWESPFWDESHLEKTNEGEDDSVVDFLWLESSPISVNSDRTKKLTRNGKPWWEDIIGIEFISSHKNILQIWLTEDQIEAVEDLPEDEVKSVLYEIIKVFFNVPAIPEPSALYKPKWLNNPYIRGTYSYPTTSLHKADKDVLLRPIPSFEKPQLLFAGDALLLERIGTVHAAYQSAEQKADIILKSLGIKDCTSVLKVIQKKKHVE